MQVLTAHPCPAAPHSSASCPPMRNLEAIYPRDGPPDAWRGGEATHTHTTRQRLQPTSSPAPNLRELDPPILRGAIVTLRWEKGDGDYTCRQPP